MLLTVYLLQVYAVVHIGLKGFKFQSHNIDFEQTGFTNNKSCGVQLEYSWKVAPNKPNLDPQHFLIKQEVSRFSVVYFVSKHI
jgi:hypothetical protein